MGQLVAMPTEGLIASGGSWAGSGESSTGGGSSTPAVGGRACAGTGAERGGLRGRGGAASGADGGWESRERRATGQGEDAADRGAGQRLVTPDRGGGGFHPATPPLGGSAEERAIDCAPHYSNGCHKTRFPINGGGGRGGGEVGCEPGAGKKETRVGDSVSRRSRGGSKGPGRAASSKNAFQRVTDANSKVLNNGANRFESSVMSGGGMRTVYTMPRGNDCGERDSIIGNTPQGVSFQATRIDDRSRVEPDKVASGLWDKDFPRSFADHNWLVWESLYIHRFPRSTCNK